MLLRGNQQDETRAGAGILLPSIEFYIAECEGVGARLHTRHHCAVNRRVHNGSAVQGGVAVGGPGEPMNRDPCHVTRRAAMVRRANRRADRHFAATGGA